MATTSTYLIAAALALLGTATTTQARLQCRFDRNSTADDCLYTVRSGYRNLRWKNETSESTESGAIVLSGTYGYSKVLLTGIRSSLPPVCLTYGLRRSTNTLFRVLSDNGTPLEPRTSSVVMWELDLEDNQSVTFEGTLYDDVEYITLYNVTAYDHMTCEQMRTGLTRPAVNSGPMPNNNQPIPPHFPNVSHTDNNPHMPNGTYPYPPHPMPNETYPYPHPMPNGTYPYPPHPMPNGTYPKPPHPMPNETYPYPPHPMPNGTYPYPPHPMPNETYPYPPHPMPNGTYPYPPHPMPNGTYPYPPHPMPNGTYPYPPHPMPNGTYPYPPHPMPNGTYPYPPYPMPNDTYPPRPHFPNGSHTDNFPPMPDGTYPYPPYFSNGSHIDHFHPMPNDTRPPHRPPPPHHHPNALPPFHEPDMDDMEPFCPESPLRLSGGTKSFGRVEVCHAGGWGTVCSDGWTAHNTRVFCNTLGFRDGITMNTSDTPNAVDGNLRIFLDGVRCKPHHHKLWHCCHNEIGVHDCDHGQDVVLSCFGEYKPPCNSSLDPECSFQHPMKPTPMEPEQPESYDYTAFIEDGQMSSETLDGYDYIEPMPMSPEQVPEEQTAPNPCESNPCLNGGECMSNGNYITCTCINGWTGRYCTDGPSPPSPPCTIARDPMCRQPPPVGPTNENGGALLHGLEETGSDTRPRPPHMPNGPSMGPPRNDSDRRPPHDPNMGPPRNDSDRRPPHDPSMGPPPNDSNGHPPHDPSMGPPPNDSDRRPPHDPSMGPPPQGSHPPPGNHRPPPRRN